MKLLTTAMAALALTVCMSFAPAQQAKADGGATIAIVGAFLLADALVGRECDHEEWPFNIVHKIGDELRGHDWCHREHHHRHHHRHHGHHHHHHHHHHAKHAHHGEMK